jgi:glycosyltransferase involved in cell wall biosynthesis
MFAMQAVHRAAGTWKKHINVYVALTDSARRRFIKAGLPPDKIFVKPNFVFDMGERKTAGKDYVLFIGRLSEEKGVRLLADAWQNLSGIPLKIAGTGPLKSVLENVNGVELLGWIEPDSLRKLVKGAKFVIVPSLCYEQFPMAVAESFCCSVPVLASNHGAMADLVEDGVTGRVFEPGSAASLAAATTEMCNNGELCLQIGRNARKEYLKKYTTAENYKMMINIYNAVINGETTGLLS